jgi:hypothetical protein
LTDLLTGLASYRSLLDALESEIKRHGRNGRSFAVLLIDLDGLKKINDAHGHLIGSRALDRVANILRIHCREIDRVWISRYHFNVSLFPASSKFAQASSFRLATHSSTGRLVSAFATSAAPLVGRDPV